MRAIFLDRDGVICENRTDHVKNWPEFEFIPGARESIAALSRLGLPIVVVTNQALVGRGLASTQDIEDIHQHMIAELSAHGGRIDRVLYCPHRSEDNCGCRKPEPGMLLQAAQEMGINLTQSYMVGDAVTDLLAGRKAGCRTFLVLTGRGFQQLLPALSTLGADFSISRNIVRATTQILKAELDIMDDSDRLNITYAQRYREILPAVTGV